MFVRGRQAAHTETRRYQIRDAFHGQYQSRTRCGRLRPLRPKSVELTSARGLSCRTSVFVTMSLNKRQRLRAS